MDCPPSPSVYIYISITSSHPPHPTHLLLCTIIRRRRRQVLVLPYIRRRHIAAAVGSGRILITFHFLYIPFLPVISLLSLSVGCVPAARIIAETTHEAQWYKKKEEEVSCCAVALAAAIAALPPSPSPY